MVKLNRRAKETIFKLCYVLSEVKRIKKATLGWLLKNLLFDHFDEFHLVFRNYFY